MRASGLKKATEAVQRGYKLSSIKNACYDIFRVKWIDEHVPSDVRMKTFLDYRAKTVDLEFKKDYPKFSAYLMEFGYGEYGIYPSKEEFLDNEFLDGNYMAELLEDHIDIYDSYCSRHEGVEVTYREDEAMEDILNALVPSNRASEGFAKKGTLAIGKTGTKINNERWY